MSGYIPTIGGSSLLVNNAVRTGAQQSGVLGTWAGHLTWDRPWNSAKIGNHYPKDYGPAVWKYFIPKDIEAIFTSTGNEQPVNHGGWNISPYSADPGTDHIYDFSWDMEDPNSKFDIYRLYITGLTAHLTSNLIATLVGYQYYNNEPSFSYSYGSFINVCTWNNKVFEQGTSHNCRYSGYPTIRWADGSASGATYSTSFTSTNPMDVRLTWGASAKYNHPAGTMNWSGTAYPVLDPQYHHVQPELSSTYTWLSLDAAGTISRIPMPSAYK